MSILKAVALFALLAAAPARAGVVINEIFYHAPEDLDDLQYIELHNTADRAVDLSGWEFSRGVRFTFPKGAKIDAGGYLVVCKSRASFKRHYGFDPAGQFEGTLSHNQERVELSDAQGRKVDGLKYGSRPPWPVAPDGYSSSLERICPAAPADAPENWAPSPWPDGGPRPAGSPGKKNANHAGRLPPAVSDVAFTPARPTPDTPITVEATVAPAEGLRQVELLYRVARPGGETAETRLAMTRKDGRYRAAIPGQKSGQVVRFRVRATDQHGAVRLFPSEHELRPALSVYVHEPFRTGHYPFGHIINVGGRRGPAAYVHVRPKTNEAELFDFITLTPRKAGHKVRLHKDRPLDGMTTLNLIYEQTDRMVVSEPLAFEVYRRAGNPTPKTDFVRTWIDGRPQGFYLLVEQPNSAFVRRIGLEKGGNLYKCVWFGQGVVGQHEKKTNPHAGHDDLVALVAELNRTKGDEQWAVIKKHFDVEQVINYFAVNMVLSHWDGYFNNYFTYHDVKGTGKWTMYPWDQDKTWGFHDGTQIHEVFIDMPITFGMQGDRPPGWPRDQPPPDGWGFGAIWWRPGGYFSKPLLANPRFRKLFLARTKELLEKVYTEEAFFPVIKELGERLEDEVKARATLRGENPKVSVEQMQRNLATLREHLTKRRKFLLEQDEVKKAGKFDRSELK